MTVHKPKKQRKTKKKDWIIGGIFDYIDKFPERGFEFVKRVTVGGPEKGTVKTMTKKELKKARTSGRGLI